MFHPSSDIYDAFNRARLVYGPSFQSMGDVKWNKGGQATGALDLQHWKPREEEDFTDPHLVHPTALDTVLDDVPCIRYQRQECIINNRSDWLPQCLVLC